MATTTSPTPTPTLDAVLRAARKGKVSPHKLATARRELAAVRALSEVALHPVQRSIIGHMRANPARPWSPKQLHELLELPLANVAYHFLRLRKLGHIALRTTQPKRGAVEHFYGLANGDGPQR